MSEAHVICANDSVEHVVIGPIEVAEKKLQDLAEAAFNRNPWHYQGSSGLNFTGTTPYEKYRNHVFWHIHTVGCDNHYPNPL